jgi:hypothetical protein
MFSESGPVNMAIIDGLLSIIESQELRITALEERLRWYGPS